MRRGSPPVHTAVPAGAPIENPRLDEIKLGRTVYQMLIRGVTQDDLREAQRQGWLTLSAKDGAQP